MRNHWPSLDWTHYILLVCCVALIVFLRFEGIILVLLVSGVVWYTLRNRPDSKETAAVVSSIRYSAEDIQDTISEYERFLTGTDTDSIADRTLQRPALADPDCTDPDIEEFHHEYSTAKRFLNRLNSKLETHDTIPQLESLLAITDRRAAALEERYQSARRAALRLGHDYS
ncbi:MULTISPECIES: hypothetical protein [Corynebacterium]|uniref:hypothetical protein n=1 Tax=Corynebacterium TaxID=1716 RepID=UPI00124F427C|nr:MULTISPECIES: hypothetical protein [Corynebacterium]MBV7281078.1 hypothetical protein [Corynebacterium sp. TAE3-ERU30]MBV7301649.1 hypothetical protein [Corynebacterium sp. TAE3-ERU2]